MRKNWPPLTLDQRELFARYEPFASNQTRLLGNRFPQFANDLHDAVIDAMIEAVSSYQENQGFSFFTHAMQIIRWRTCDVIRRNVAKSRKVGLSRPIQENMVFAMNPGFKSIDQADAVEFCLSMVDSRSREILRLHHMDDLRLEEVADRIGFSRSRVSQLINRDRAYLSNLTSVMVMAS